MRSDWRLLKMVVLLLAPWVLPALLCAQDNPESAPLNLGGFNTQGSVSFGYRFDSLKGYQPMYLELFDLQKGPRLEDFDIFGEAATGASLFADSYSLSMSGLGGDPFPTAQFTIKKKKLYDLRVNWRQSYYYWNQNDNVVLPIAAAAAGLGKGLTDNHNWATVRKFGSADLTLHATDHLRFNLNFYRTTDGGTTFTTASPDFLGSPAYWGTYARGNPFPLYAPINDDTNRFTGGIDYTIGTWSFHYALGYQTFTENMGASNLSPSELSIDPVGASLVEPIKSFTWTEYRRLTTPISELSYVGKPHPKLEWRGGYIFYRYRGPATFNESFNGTAPNASGVQSAYAVTENAQGMLTEPDNILNQGLTYQVNSWFSLNLDYRYSRLSSEGTGNFGSLLNATTATNTTADVVWRMGLSDLDFRMDFAPLPNLVIRPGVHFMKADVETLDGGVADPALTLRTNTVWPEISIGYEPSKIFSVRGDIHSFDAGASYTAMTPHTEVGGKIVTQIHPINKLTIEDELRVSNSKLIATNYQDNIHDNAATISYALNDRFSIFGGFSYSSFFAQGNVVYARGTAPLQDLERDQEIDRVWQGGLEVKPAKRFGARISGNYDRSTGLGQISGEPPAYGPLRWPLITGTVFYDVPRAGRFSIDLQRTYYIEQIVTANNFQADLLTVKWTRNF